MKVYLIPGLGYDCRIFGRLDLQAFDVTELNWIEPTTHEKIHDYAQRLFSQVEPSSEPKVLIGHSLGGVVAQEIASVNTIQKVILVSSIKSRKELSIAFKLVRPLRLDRFFTKGICLKTIGLWGKSHGFKLAEDRDLFKSMIGNQTNSYLQWALRELSSWQEPERITETQIVHLHGTDDKTLPYHLIKQPDVTIENGSHICVLKKAAELSGIINKLLRQVILPAQ